MKCQGKNIRTADTQDCLNDAIGIFKTKEGNIPLCNNHLAWAKENNMILRKKDNYFG